MLFAISFVLKLVTEQVEEEELVLGELTEQQNLFDVLVLVLKDISEGCVGTYILSLSLTPIKKAR